MAEQKSVFGILARFDSPTALMGAARKMDREGYRSFDCHSPFPIHGMDHAMGMKKSKLGWIVAACGFLGASGALLMQWWMSTVDYPLVISGKPFFSLPAFIPITFELCVLLSGFGTLFGFIFDFVC